MGARLNNSGSDLMYQRIAADLSAEITGLNRSLRQIIPRTLVLVLRTPALPAHRPMLCCSVGSSRSPLPALSVMRPFRLTVLLFLVCLLDATAQITLNPAPTRVIGQLSTTLNSFSPNLVEGREFQAPQGVVWIRQRRSRAGLCRGYRQQPRSRISQRDRFH